MAQEYTIHRKTLFNSSKCEAVKDFLSVVSIEDIYSICHTATIGRVKPECREDAIDAILLFSENLERLFSYQKIKIQDLKYYLKKNNVENIERSTKLQLIADIYKLWDAKFSVSTVNTKFSSSAVATRPIYTGTSTNNLQDDPQPSSIRELSKNSSSENKVQSVRSDVFAKEFVVWFYANLNLVIDPMKNSSFNGSVFCTNSKSDIFFVSPSSTEKLHSEGCENCALLFQNTVREHQFSFSPNTESGIIAKESAHGLVQVFACGTLHVGSNFIGIFEQEFGLVKNPKSVAWQIFYTNMNLKSGVKDVPSLPSATVFEIVNS